MAAEAHTFFGCAQDIEKNHGAVERSDIMGPRDFAVPEGPQLDGQLLQGYKNNSVIIGYMLCRKLCSCGALTSPSFSCIP